MRSKLTIAILVAVILAGTASAEVLTNVKNPVTWSTIIPCTGDLVEAEGMMHYLFAVTIDGDGGVHVKSHTQPQGLAGEVIAGPNLGAKYNGVGVTQDTYSYKPAGFPYTYIAINNFRWIGKGEAANYMVHSTDKITINANGVVTVNVIKTRITCE